MRPARCSLLAIGSATRTAGEWVDVFWSSITPTAMTTYYLVFTGDYWLGIMGDPGNPYPNGHAYANEGYDPFITYDFAFRTWYDETPVSDTGTWSRIKATY